MARTLSTMMPLGQRASDFALSDAAHPASVVTRSSAEGRPLLLMFICNHCPYVVHVIEVLAALANEFAARGVAVVAINSNDIERFPEDAPAHMAALASRLAFRFPFCFDATQEVAKAYTAACTPDFFLFDVAHTLVYRGQMDDSRPGSGIPVTGQDLRAALEAVLAGHPPLGDQHPSLGCNIKWRPGNEPSYFG